MLSRERQVLVVQMEALRAEAQQAEGELEDQYNRHQTELHCLREESLQVRIFSLFWIPPPPLSISQFTPVLVTAFTSMVC